MAETKAQKPSIGRVLHEEKQGKLKTSTGQPVKRRKQAVAIALREAGAANQESPAQNKKNPARTGKNASRSKQEK